MYTSQYIVTYSNASEQVVTGPNRSENIQKLQKNMKVSKNSKNFKQKSEKSYVPEGALSFLMHLDCFEKSFNEKRYASKEICIET